MPNVAEHVWNWAKVHPDHTALRAVDRQLTYRELRDAVAAYAGALRAAGIEAGDRVLLCAPSVPEFLVARFAVHVVGGILVTVNTMATRAEIEYMLDDAECSLAIVWTEIGPATAAAARGRGVPCWTLEHGAGALEGEPIDDLFESAPDDAATILYTSGTTGKPKGATITTANLLETARIFEGALDMRHEDRVGTALPLFHVFGLAVMAGTTLRAGATFSVLPRFDPVEMLELLIRDRLTVMAGVPTMWSAMLQAAGDHGPDDFSGLRLAVSGGASLPVELLTRFRERFGCEILEGYGLSETTGAATFNSLDRPRKPAHVGIALDGMQVEVRREDGQACDVDEVGEVYIKGPTLMKGYWGRSEATAEAVVDGWLRTGDLGAHDEDGDFRIVDRLKDLIIRGGYNIYPREVEEVLHGHPDIAEVAVVGVPDDYLGEEVAAVIVPRPGAEIDTDELRLSAKQLLSAYKVPRLFQFVDELPKGETGKVVKRAIDRDALREAALRRTASR